MVIWVYSAVEKKVKREEKNLRHFWGDILFGMNLLVRVELGYTLNCALYSAIFIIPINFGIPLPVEILKITDSGKYK